MATGYTLGSLNYNLGAQVLYKINKKFSAVLNSDLYLKRFSFKSNNKQYKTTMFDITAGINYYVPVGNGSPYFTLNTGLYRNRLGYEHTLYFPDGSSILEEDNWKSRLGINGGLGVDLKLFKNTEWTFLSKYHYLFEGTKDTKFISLNLGLKYNF